MVQYTPVSGIYVILNTKNDMIYIGQTQDIRKRLREHKSMLNGNYHSNSKLQRAWNKYGEKIFKFKILEYCSIEQLDDREQHYLDIYTPRGMCYNIAIDAKVPSRGTKRSEASRLKMSEAQRNRPPHSEESRQRRRKAMTGRIVSDETRRKQSEAAKGNTRKLGMTHSDETRHKISEGLKGNQIWLGRKHTEASKQKNRETHIGHKPSDETRKKMSEAHKGKLLNDETRQKMSEAGKLAWERRRNNIQKDN